MFVLEKWLGATEKLKDGAHSFGKKLRCIGHGLMRQLLLTKHSPARKSAAPDTL
jgi:hypothetical protein